MEQRYNIYYAGELLEGRQHGEVRAALAKLFNAGDETLDRLFSGKSQLIKRECDKATALKFKQAMERAGARPLIKLARESGEAPPPPPAREEPQSAAEKIAALAAAPDAGYASARPDPATADTAPDSAAEAATGSLDLCPDGTEVLRPDERAAPVQADIDTSALAVDEGAQRLSPESAPPPASPDTSHLTLDEAGDTLPNLPPERPPLNPDTSGISLSPGATDFSDCARPAAPPPELDLSGIEVAPPGTAVLHDHERRNDEDSTPPDTGHIQLAD